jgi:beta-glucosidase
LDRRTFISAAAGTAAVAAASEVEAAKGGAGFPKGFQWGVATAAHQIEGNNVNSDFWLMEHLKGSPFREPSGDACDSYHRYNEDIAIVAGLGLSTYRFSIEWARIEPEPGRFSQAEIDYYRRIIEACRAKGVRPLATFHHFTSPRWLSAMGGWTDPSTPARFADYAARLTKAFGDVLDGVCTINEPNGPVEEFGLRLDKPVPGEGLFAMLAAKACGTSTFATFGLGDALKTRDGMIEGHKKARAAIKAERSGLPVGMTLALTEMSAAPGGEALYAHVYDQGRKPFYEAAKGDYFVGVQTYTRTLVGPAGRVAPTGPVLQMGYEYWPTSLGACVREAAKATGCPIFVTENGIGTEDDAERIRYTEEALKSLLACIRDGIDVRGYIHWSLMDNFEWLEGYRPKFGIVSVDRQTFRRTLKPSAQYLAKLARTNGAILA